MKAFILICVLFLSGCRTISVVDRHRASETVQLSAGWVKTGWLASYTIDVLSIDGADPRRRMIYDGSREEGAILVSPGYHLLRLRVIDRTKLTSPQPAKELIFGMTAVLGSVYSLRLEEGEVLLYRWPDIPDGPGKQMKREPNQPPQTTPVSAPL